MNIGTIRGIKLKLHYSTLIIAILIGYAAGSFYYAVTDGTAIWWELLIIGIASGIIIIFSIFLHEIMHSLVAQRYGMVISEIELYLFGGVSKLEGEPKTPGQEAKMAIIGPLTSLALAGAFYGVFYSPIPMLLLIAGIIYYAGWSNLILGLFNLLPAFPMDGGRVLRAILWWRRKDLVSATRAASKVGSFFGYGMMVVGIGEIFLLGTFDGLWFIILGSFLNSSAKQSYAQTAISEGLGKFPAKQLLGRPHPSIKYDENISDAIRDYFLPYQMPFFPVERDGRIIGIIYNSQVKTLPASKRNVTKASDLMIPIQGFPFVWETATGKEILEKLNRTDTSHRVVLVRRFGDGFVIGMIGEGEIQSAVDFLNWGSGGYPEIPT